MVSFWTVFFNTLAVISSIFFQRKLENRCHFNWWALLNFANHLVTTFSQPDWNWKRERTLSNDSCKMWCMVAVVDSCLGWIKEKDNRERAKKTRFWQTHRFFSYIVCLVDINPHQFHVNSLQILFMLNETKRTFNTSVCDYHVSDKIVNFSSWISLAFLHTLCSAFFFFSSTKMCWNKVEYTNHLTK